MEQQELKRVVEALIFAADAPLTTERIHETLPEELNGFDLNQLVEDLNRDYAESGRAFFIRQIAGGYQVTTRPELHSWVKKLFLGRNKMRLSHAGLETLAIVAFKQPISRVDVAQIRGVNSDGVIGTLLERKLITISGRSEGIGRPLLYNTTPEFLQYFGVNDLSDLPKPREIEELIGKEGMPEEVLQALSDDKQLELPINIEEAQIETEETAPAQAAPASFEEKSIVDIPTVVKEGEPEEALTPARFEENSIVDAPTEIVEEEEPEETSTSAHSEENSIADDPTEIVEEGEPEEVSKPARFEENSIADAPAAIVEEGEPEEIAAGQDGDMENEIAEENEIPEADESEEAEVDAIVVEDPDVAETGALEEEDDSSEENGEEEKNTAPIATAHPIAGNEVETRAFVEREPEAQPHSAFDRREATAPVVAPDPGANFFLEQVRIVELEALTTPVASLAQEEIIALHESLEPMREYAAEQIPSEDLLRIGSEEITDALPQTPAVQVVEIEHVEIIQPLQMPIEVDAAMPGSDIEEETEAVLISAASTHDFQHADETVSAAQMAVARAPVAREDATIAPAHALAEIVEEHPRFAESAAPITIEKDEDTLFFDLAPSENGAQQTSAIESESGVIVFFKKAVGWIKSAWQKILGR